MNCRIAQKLESGDQVTFTNCCGWKETKEIISIKTKTPKLVVVTVQSDLEGMQEIGHRELS